MPVTYSFKQITLKVSSRQLHQLYFLSQFSTDIRYIDGPRNVIEDSFSQISTIGLPSTIDFSKLAEVKKEKRKRNFKIYFHRLNFIL